MVSCATQSARSGSTIRRRCVIHCWRCWRICAPNWSSWIAPAATRMRPAAGAADSSSSATTRWWTMIKMMANDPADMSVGQIPSLTRAAVIAQIEERLAGQIDDAALAAWAFDRFYAQELGQESYESGAEPAIANVLDA